MSDEQIDEVDAGREVTRTIRKTPRAKRHHLALVIHESGRVEQTSRADLHTWLRANDLGPLADEAARRRVPPGSILVLNLRRTPRFAILSPDGQGALVSKPMPASPAESTMTSIGSEPAPVDHEHTEPEPSDHDRPHVAGRPIFGRRTKP